MKAVEAATASFRQLVSQPLLPVFATILDALFLFLYGFFTQPFRDTLTANAQNLVTVLGQQLQDAGGRYETPSMLALVFSPAARPYLWGVLFWLFLLGVVAFILYVFFQGTIWQLTTSRPWKSYLKQFALLNLIWAVILVIVRGIVDLIDLRSAFIQSITREPGWVVPNSLRIAGLIVLLYFILRSYAELREHPWKVAFKRAWNLKHVPVLAIALLAVACLAVDALVLPFVLTPLIQFSEPLGLTLSIAILGPLAWLARVYISKTFAGA
jgi:hypothetical protein